MLDALAKRLSSIKIRNTMSAIRPHPNDQLPFTASSLQPAASPPYPLIRSPSGSYIARKLAFAGMRSPPTSISKLPLET